MSGFNADWLDLREPVDRRSRDPVLFQAAVQAASRRQGCAILDIGCGTGSTFRALSPAMPANVRWQLLDNDPALLEEVRRRHGDHVVTVRADLGDIETLAFEETGLVTASALFDLCSEHFIRIFAKRAAEMDADVYATLNYDGAMAWSKPHPLDDAVTASFNAHQLSDKGLGPSLGPNAWERLAENLSAQDYGVRIAESPWLMTAADADLQLLFLQGVVRAVIEYGDLDHTEIGDWLQFRRRMIERDDSLCRVGHQDILALRHGGG